MEQEYNPLACDHKKQNGFSAFELLSHSSGNVPTPNYEENVLVCLLCGEVRVSGKHGDHKFFSFDFSIHYPDAVAAIVKYCNYMNQETEGYMPFVQQQPSLSGVESAGLLQWVCAYDRFPIRTRVVAKTWSHNSLIVGHAASATGGTLTINWGTGSITLAKGHEELKNIFWLDESASRPSSKDTWEQQYHKLFALYQPLREKMDEMIAAQNLPF